MVALLSVSGVTTVSLDGKRRIAKQVAFEWGEKVKRYSSQYMLSPQFVVAMICQESAGDPNAQNSADPSRGLMQLTPGVVNEYIAEVGNRIFPPDGGAYIVSWDTVYVPAVNLTIGIWYLNKKLREHGTLDRAIVAYNGSGLMAELHWQRVKLYVEIIEQEKLI